MNVSRFDRTGRLRFPAADKALPTEVATAMFTVNEAFCPHGHNLVSERFRVGDKPGILIGFRRPGGQEGEVVCPVCQVRLDVLCHCEFHRQAPVCLLYQTSHLDLDDAIAFCCVVGCPNSSYRRAGEVIRAIRVPHL